MLTPATSHKRRIQVLLLSWDHQRLEPVANTHHRPPEPSGIQGYPCKPPSHTPDVQLDSQLPVNSFKWGTGVFICFYQALQFYTGYNTIWRRFLPLIWKKKKITGKRLRPAQDQSDVSKLMGYETPYPEPCTPEPLTEITE